MVSFVDKMNTEVREHQEERVRQAKKAEIENREYRKKEWEKLLAWIESGGWKKKFSEEHQEELKRYNRGRDFFLLSSLRDYPSFIPYEEDTEMMAKINAAFQKEGFHSASYDPPTPGDHESPGASPTIWVWVVDPKSR